MILRPRLDYVVFKRVLRGQTSAGIHIPDKSLEGMDHVIIAVGPDVEGLAVGDMVLILGEINKDYGPIPNMKNHYLTKQSNVCLIYERDEVLPNG